MADGTNGQEKRKPVLFIMVGLPRSGKSTWIKSNLKDIPIVSPDEIRLAMHGQRYVQSAEPYVWATAMTMVLALFGAGHMQVVVDATNTRRKNRDFWKSDKWDRVFIPIETNRYECYQRAKLLGDSYILPIIDKQANAMEPIADDEMDYRRYLGHLPSLGRPKPFDDDMRDFVALLKGVANEPMAGDAKAENKPSPKRPIQIAAGIVRHCGSSTCENISHRNHIVLGRWDKYHKFAGKLALPGGKVEDNETAYVACTRELKEELGINVNVRDLHKMGVFSPDALVAKGLHEEVEITLFDVTAYTGTPKPMDGFGELVYINVATITTMADFINLNGLALIAQAVKEADASPVKK